MKINGKLLAALLLVLVLGCRDKVNDTPHVNPTYPDAAIKVTIDVIVQENDTFSLYYTKDGSINFGEIQPIWTPVKGSKAVQQVSYELPLGVANPQLRLDFGMNKNQKDIILKKIAITFGDQYFETSGRHIFNLFTPDPSKCTVDIDEGKIIAKMKDGVRQSPSLYPREKLLAREISKLTGRDK